ncbi:uncharacterized protein CBL_11231 [Carabus blaptoides fortunei]
MTVAACNRTYYGDVGRTYELEIRRPREDRLPFLCHLNFTAGGGTLGDLIQKMRNPYYQETDNRRKKHFGTIAIVRKVYHHCSGNNFNRYDSAAGNFQEITSSCKSVTLFSQVLTSLTPNSMTSSTHKQYRRHVPNPPILSSSIEWPPSCFIK